MQFDKGELGRAVDRDEHVELALFSAHFGVVDVDVVDRVALELLLCRSVTSNIAQPTNAMALQATMQWRPCQMPDRRLQVVKTVTQRQQGVATEGNDDGLFFD